MKGKGVGQTAVVEYGGAIGVAGVGVYGVCMGLWGTLCWCRCE